MLSQLEYNSERKAIEKSCLVAMSISTIRLNLNSCHVLYFPSFLCQLGIIIQLIGRHSFANHVNYE